MVLRLLLLLQFENEEKKRMKAEQLRQELKHRKQWDDLQLQNSSAIKELEQLQVNLYTLQLQVNLYNL